MLMALLMSISGWAQVESQVGDEISSSIYVPSYMYYDYAISQCLYTSAELSEVPAGTITSISYKNVSNYAPTRTWKILLGETTLTSLSNSSFVAESDLTEVFSGSVALQTNGWTTITFTTPFTYSGGNLVVTVLDNTGEYTGNYPSFAVCTSSGQTLYDYMDNTPFTISALYDANDSFYKPVIKLAVTIQEGYCAPVSNLAVSDITTSSATITWDEMQDANGYSYQFKKALDSWVENGDLTSSTNTVSLTDLESATPYNVRVKANCESSESIYRNLNFYTSCATITNLPWSIDFESETVDNIPNCWDVLNPYTDYPKVTLSGSSHVYSGSKALEFRADSKKSFAILPPFETSINDLQLSFYTQRESSYSGTLLIGYMTDITDTNTFVAIDSITATSIGDNNYHLYEVSYANVILEDGVTARMALAYHTRGTYSSYYWYVDNVEVGLIPACSRPTQISTSVTSSTATINWTSTATNFEVYYKVDSAQQYETATNFTSATTDNTYTITLESLTPATQYSYYIKAICEDTIQSEVKTFKTECVALTTVPQTWDFEINEEETELPVCWTKYPSTTTNVRYSSTYKANGENSLYIYGTNVVAVLPTIDLTQLNLTDLQLRFNARQGYSNAILQVGIMSDINDTSTFETVASFPLSTTFTEKVAMFSSYTGQGQYIALRGATSSVSVYIDDIVLENIPACPPVQQIQVTSISSDGATVTWSGNNDSYLVRYRAETDTIWSTDNITTTGTSATISLLSANTDYIVSIAPDCEETTDSTYRATSFTTLCSMVDAPYFIDFEDETMINCWTVASESEVYDNYYGWLNYPVLYQSSDATVSHSPILFWGLAANGDDPVIVAAPKVNLDIEQTRFSFYIRKNYDYSYMTFDDIEVGIMTNPNDTSTFIPLHTINASDITEAYSLQQIDFNQFTEYTGNNYHVAIRYLGAYSMYYTGVYYIDDVTITYIPSCSEPTGLTASNPTTNSVDLTWTSEESDFKVYYKPASAGDDVAYTSVNATLTDGVYTLSESDIQPGTMYKYYVAAICSDNSEAPSMISYFTTRCVSLDVPYTVDFEDITIGSRPICWTFINSDGIYPSVSDSRYRGHNSAKGLEFRSTTNVTTASIAVMPHFTENLNQLYVEFWSKPESDVSTGEYASGRLEIGYMTDTTDVATFVVLDSISVYTITDSAYHKYRVVFNDVDLGDATMGYIAFRHVANGNYYWYLDDVKVAEIPNCIEPSQLASSNPTVNSINLSWTSSATNLTLSYKEISATEYTDIENVSLDENGVYTLTGLTPNTTYDWKVSFICASDNETYVSNVMIFTTPCDAISTVPQTWDFETDNTSGSYNNPLPSCWTRLGSYPYVSSFVTPYAGLHALYFYDSGIGILPQIDTETLPMNTLQLSLYARKSEYSSNFNLEVGVMTDPTNVNTFTLVSSIPLTSTYTYCEVPLSSYTGEGTYIALRNNTTNICFVDNVTLELIPTCSRPSDITITTTSDEVTLTWMSTGEDFEIYYKEASETDYDLATTTVSAGATNNTWTATVSNLTPATTYDIYVKAVCNEGPQLESSVVTFTTSCVSISTVPQTWDFEETGNTAGTTSYPLPSCWTRTGTSQPYSYYGPGVAYQGSYALYSYNNNSLAVLPPIDTETLSLNSLQLSFYGKNGGYNATTVEVGVMTDPADANTFTLVSSVELTSSYELYEISFASYTGTGSYIALRNVSSSSMYVDNVTLDQSSDCARPSAVTVSASQEQATITWASMGQSFEIYYKTSTASTYDIADATITAGATEGTWTAVINALSPSTLYDVYIKVICGEGSDSQSNVVSFRTECTAIAAFPYTENFESLSTSDLGCWRNETVSGSANWEIKQFGTEKVAYRTYAMGASYLISPVFDITSLNTPALSYNWETSRYSTDFDSLYVCYRTSPTSDWLILVAHGPSRASDIVSAPSQDTIIALPNASSTYQIAFLASCHGGYGVSVDNVVINNNGGVVIPVEPTVATNNTSNIAQTSVTLNGTITNAGNQTITAKGFEWKTTFNGTYTQVLSSDEGNTFTYNLTNLTANTSYTYKAFVTTANGTVYGSEIVFTTFAEGDEPCTTVIASFSKTICDGETFSFNGQSYTTTGMYTTLVAGQNGDCDTSYTITLTVLPQIAETITETLCYGETFTFNGQTYNASGTYTTTVASQNEGCDTLYTINLTILPQNAPINDEVTISQSELPYSYHGQTYSDFGSYTLTTQDENGCDQVYNLTLVHNSGIAEVEGGLMISLYPNPTDNNATLRVKGLTEQATIIITDQQGRVVSSKVLAQDVETVEIETANLASGVYYIRIQTANTIKTEKLIKN